MNHDVTSSGDRRPRAAVIGGAVFDRKYHARAPLVAGTSNPADGSHSHGGVARNMAENLARLGVAVSFFSIVGDDDTGAALLAHLRALGVDVGGVARTGERPTAEYVAILDPANELALGVADMAIFDLYSKRNLDLAWPNIEQAEWVLADCNLPAAVLEELVGRCHASDLRIAVNTVSAPKAIKVKGLLGRIDVLFTNRAEAAALADADSAGLASDAVAAMGTLVRHGARSAVVTDGAAGYALMDRGMISRHDAVHARPVDITGAGDAFVAGTLCRLMAGDGLARAAEAGAWLAARTTETEASVLPDLSPEYFDALAEPAPARG